MFVERDRNERTIIRESKACLEHNVRIRAFAERDKIHAEVMSPSQLQYMIGPGGNGIQLELVGYGDAITVLLKFAHIPYIEVFVRREPEASFTDPCYEFSKTKDDQIFLNELKQQLGASIGGAGNTLGRFCKGEADDCIVRGAALVRRRRGGDERRDERRCVDGR